MDGGGGGALSIFGRGAAPRAVRAVRRRILVQKTLGDFPCRGEGAADGDSIVSFGAGYGSARSNWLDVFSS